MARYKQSNIARGQSSDNCNGLPYYIIIGKPLQLSHPRTPFYSHQSLL